MKTHLILGTAGHIDHGKTSLIKRLTGTDTDRLPEEQKRGITIELGYAVLELEEFRLGIVDVPGHEKFVRQMLSGATGMDLVLLVVAADDSVKRQTVEHLEILRLLDLPAGVIALTKADSVEPEWLEMVADEVRQRVAGTFLADAPIIPTSAHTGEGIESLKAAILAAARSLAGRSDSDSGTPPFRMAIDRVFPIEGHGTVVTGSVSSGSVSIGDKLELQPGGVEVRIREIQNHDRQVDSIARGQRGAINLAGVHHGDIHRGQELATPGHLVPTRILSVSINLLDDAARPLKDRQRVRFHIGTTEVLASVRLLEARELAPGKKGLAQLFLSEPVVAVWNQPFVLRSESPVVTIGGGRILHSNPSRIRRIDTEALEKLRDLGGTVPSARVAAALYFSSLESQQLTQLARIAGVADGGHLAEELIEQGVIVQIPLSTQRSLFIHSAVIEGTARTIVGFLNRFHDEDPLAMGVKRSVLENHFSWLDSREIFKLALELLADQKAIQKSGEIISLAGRGPQLTTNERKLLVQIIERYEGAGLEPPTTEELQREATKAKDSVPQLIELATNQGELVRLDEKIVIHRKTLEDIQGRLRDAFGDGSLMTVSDMRQVLSTSRKYAVPLAEYLDTIGFTRRTGDSRSLVDSAGAAEEASSASGDGKI